MSNSRICVRILAKSWLDLQVEAAGREQAIERLHPRIHQASLDSTDRRLRNAALRGKLALREPGRWACSNALEAFIAL